MRLLLILLFLLLPGTARAQAWADAADAAVALDAPTVTTAGKRAAFVFAAAPAGPAFDGIVAQGFAGGATLDGAVRFGTAGGWTAWQPLYLVRSATDDAFLAAYRGGPIREGVEFELRFEVDSGADVTLLGAGVFDSRRDGEPGGGHAEVSRWKAPSDFLIVAPELNPRAAWNAAPFRGDPLPLNRPDYVYLTFHHAAGFGAYTREDGLRQVKNIQDFHQNGRGWSDIGYQYVMDQEGRLYQGRPYLRNDVPFAEGPPLVQGAHVGGANTGNIGVSFLGCYHPPEGAACDDRLSEAAFDSLLTVFAYLSERYGVPPENFRGHRDFSSTACPGDHNYALLPTIRTRVAELLQTGNRPLGAATLAAAVGEGGVVRLDWEFLEDGGIASYRLERFDAGSSEPVVVFEGEGAVPDTFADVQVGRTGPLTYRLVARSGSGREQILAVAAVEVAPPETYTLAEVFPNPFREHAHVRYFLERDGLVRLTLHDALGREVRRLVDAYQGGGRWYGHTLDAAGLPSGLYVARLLVEGFAGIDHAETKTLVRVH